MFNWVTYFPTGFEDPENMKKWTKEPNRKLEPKLDDEEIDRIFKKNLK